MSKINAVIKREYLTRVKKISFIVMTILIPFGMLVMIGFPLLMSYIKIGTSNVCVLDESGMFTDRLEGTNSVFLTFVTGNVEDWKENFKDQYDALLHIPNFDLQYPGGVTIYSENQIGIGKVNNLEKQIEQITEHARFEHAGIDRDLVEKLRIKMKIENIVIAKGEEKSGNVVVAMILGQIMGFFMYFFIFMYGSMIMKGVIDEKKNRIVEILVSSIKPFDLMLGKIIGIALVALTQLLIWVVMTVIIFAFFIVGVIPYLQGLNATAGMEMVEQMPMDDNFAIKMANFVQDPGALNMPFLIIAFCFYFIFGYLFYSTMFAGIGSVSDDESNSQMFTLPISLPIMISLFIMLNVAQNPNSSMAIWASIIPFSSPIIMLARIPFGVPVWQIIVSALCLIICFIGSTWVSGKIYRIGILLYGKKLNWKDLWKFIQVRN